MIKHVAGRDAEVVGVRRREVLEVAADFVEELETDLREGGAAADEELPPDTDSQD